MCICPPGTFWSRSNEKCVRLAPEINDKKTKTEPKACIYGLDECPVGEECFVKFDQLHSKRGKCYEKCPKETVRNRNAVCVDINQLGGGESLLNEDSRKLTVDIDGPTVVRLPLNEVSLNAKVSLVSDNQTDSDNVKYEWNIVSSPKLIKDGKEVVSIAGGRASKTLKLTEVC